MNKVVMPIVAVGVVLVVLLVLVKVLFFPAMGGERTITSQGTSELKAQPDLAEIYLRISILKPTAESAEEVSAAASKAVTDAMKSFENATLETLSYNIYKKEDWAQSGPVFKGYMADYALKVTTKNFRDVGKIIDAGVTAGVTGVDNVQFTLSKSAEEKVRAQALKEAGESARMKAEATVAGVGVSLGSIVSVAENGFYAPPWMYAQATDTVAAGEKASGLVIVPSTLDISATVTVTYKIK